MYSRKSGVIALCSISINLRTACKAHILKKILAIYKSFISAETKVCTLVALKSASVPS